MGDSTVGTIGAVGKLVRKIDMGGPQAGKMMKKIETGGVEVGEIARRFR